MELYGSIHSISGSMTASVFTGSFKGDGSGLTNIPASSVSGLNLSQIVTGSVSASLSLVGFNVNTNTSITGSLTVSGAIRSTTTTLVSGSSQISHDSTTGYVANQHIDHTTVSISPGSGLSGGGTIATTRTLTLDTGSVHFLDGVKKELNTEGVISGSVQIGNLGYAITGSNTFNGNQTITGSLTVTGDIVAQTLNVQQVTSSIIYSSGSNVFGDSLTNTQQFTGSVGITGSLSVNNTPAMLGTIASGQVAFGTGTGVIGGDAGLFWDNVNKRLGIGTTSPNGRFVVNGGGSSNMASFTNDTQGGLIAIGNSNSNGTPGTNSIGGVPYGAAVTFGVVDNQGIRVITRTNAAIMSANIGSWGRGSLLFLTKGTLDNSEPTEKWRISESGILQSNGAQTIQTSTGSLTLQPSNNVLIGTTTDNGAKLQVNGVISATGGTSTDWNAKIGGTIASGQLAFGTGSGVIGGDDGLFWDNANKRLGIGINNPSDKLYIRDNTGGSNANFRFFGNVTAGYTSFISMDNTGLKLGTQIGNRNLEFQINSITRWGILTDGILQSNGAQTIQTSIGDLTLATGGGNGNILLSPNGNGQIIMQPTGNNTSIVRLRPSGTSTITPLLSIGDSSTGAIGTNFFSFGTGDVTLPSTDPFYISSTVGGTPNANSKPIAFLVSNTSNGRFEAIRITSSGNVLIGTTTDNGAKLQVNGVISATGGTSTDWNDKIGGTIASGQVAFGTGAGVIGGSGRMVYDGTIARLSLRFGTNPILRFDNTTDFAAGGWTTVNMGGMEFFTSDLSGIGAHIGASIRARNFNPTSDARTTPNFELVFSTSPLNSVEVERWKISQSGIFESNGAQTIQTSGTESLTLQANGGNLIAFSTSFSLADINGNGTYQGRTNLGRAIFSGGSNGISDSGAFVARGSLHGSNPHGSEIWAGGLEAVRITSSRNVGIGTSSPNLKLHISDDVNGEGGLRIRNINSGTTATAMFRMNNNLGNDAATQVLMFLNSSTRTADGGVNTFSIRNNIGAVRLMSTSGADLSFWTSTTDERMRITSGGNVLIDQTVSTGEKLQVNGDAKIVGNITTNDLIRYSGTFNSGASVSLPLRGGAQRARLFLVHYRFSENTNLNAARLMMVNTRNTIVGGGNSITVITTTQNSTGTPSEPTSFTQSIGGSGDNLTLVIGASLVGGSGSITVDIQEVLA